MAIISAIGTKEFGGYGLLSTIPSLILVVLVSLLFYWWGRYSSFLFMNKRIKENKAKVKSKKLNKKILKRKK